MASGTREAVVLLPRGNGKTSLLALVALHHLVTVPDAKVVVAAASRQQAEHLFSYALRFADALGDPHIVPRYHVLRWVPEPRRQKVWTRSLEVWAQRRPQAPRVDLQPGDRGRASGARRRRRVRGARERIHKRASAQLVTISTAGQGTDSPLGVLRARALALPNVKRRGAVTDARGPGLRFLEWTLPDDADVSSARVVKRANPASWITLEAIAHARDGLPDLAYRRFVCNQWTSRASHWLPPGAWQHASRRR